MIITNKKIVNTLDTHTKGLGQSTFKKNYQYTVMQLNYLGQEQHTCTKYTRPKSINKPFAL